jgi:hypothetical protein
VCRKKCHELAWTFLNTMNNVQHYHTLHNNMSSDNIMLHFPPNSQDKVYIGICNWAMAGNFNDLKKSLYIHESQEARIRIMEHKWWVALELNYFLLPPLNGGPSSLRRVKLMQWAKLPNGPTVAISPSSTTTSTTKKREEMTRSASQQWIKSFNVVWNSSSTQNWRHATIIY